MAMNIISRAEWGARPPKTTPVKITTPTKELWLHHTASPSGYAPRVRAIQNFHMDVRGWSDIAYSFLVNHAGDIYEGRGAGVRGAHTAGHNSISHAICVMGDYNKTVPSQAALDAVVELAAYGHSEGWWPELFTGGHRDASGADTSCPGDNLYSKIPFINTLLEGEDDMPLTADDIEKVAVATRDKILYDKWSDTASIKQAIGRTYEQSVLGSANVSDAELDAAVDELIAVLPERTLALLKEKL